MLQSNAMILSDAMADDLVSPISMLKASPSDCNLLSLKSFRLQFEFVKSVHTESTSNILWCSAVSFEHLCQC